MCVPAESNLNYDGFGRMLDEKTFSGSQAQLDSSESPSYSLFLPEVNFPFIARSLATIYRSYKQYSALRCGAQAFYPVLTSAKSRKYVKLSQHNFSILLRALN